MTFIEELLKIYPIFNQLSDNSLFEIEKHTNYLKLKKHDILKKSDQSCVGFPLLIDGELEVTKISDNGDLTFLFFLKPGDICHQTIQCINNNNDISLQVTASKASNVGLLPIDIYNAYLKNNVEFNKYLYADLFRKLNLIINIHENTIHISVENRLLNLLQSYKKSEIYVTHQQLALELGTAREVVTRNLNKLANKNIVVLKRGLIILKNFND